MISVYIVLGHNSDVFSYAKALMDICGDSTYGQDDLTPMDALIVADALIDNECSKAYTSDSMLLIDTQLHDKIDEIRKQIGYSYPKLRFSKFQR
jgi:hypothetical protein